MVFWTLKKMSVEFYHTGVSVVAGLVPATSLWFGISSNYQRDWRKLKMRCA